MESRINKRATPSRGSAEETFNYKRTFRDDNGIPAVIGIAFGYCPESSASRRLITGVKRTLANTQTR